MENNSLTKRFSCPCCGYLTLEEEHHFEVCPVCFWEDDPIQSEDQKYKGGANKMSLEEARKNFQLYGAVDKEFLQNVRKPEAEEIPLS